LGGIDWLICLLLVFIGVLVFYTFTISPPSDLYDYLTIGVNLYRGNGPVGMTGEPNITTMYRPPGFPGIIALSYALLGVSFRSAFWAIRFFCIAAPVVVFLVGRYFFGRKTGFIAGILILTSYTVAVQSYGQIDAIWPLFIIAGIALTVAAFERQSWLLAVAASVSFALPFWIKELALLFIPFPLIYFFVIKRFRNKEVFVKAVAITALPLFSVILWMIIAKRPQEGVDMGGRLLADLFAGWDGTGFPPVIKIFAAWGDSLIRTAIRFLRGVSLAPLLVIGWLYIFYRAVRGDYKSSAIALGLALYAPIIISFSIVNLRLGQLIIALYLSYLALGFTLVSSVGWLSGSKLGLSPNWSRSVLFSVTAILALIQFLGMGPVHVGALTWYDKGLISFMKENRSLPAEIVREGENKFQIRVVGVTNIESVEKALEYLKPSLRPGDGIMCDRFFIARLAFIRAEGRYKMFDVPGIEYGEGLWTSRVWFIQPGSPTDKLWQRLANASDPNKKPHAIYFDMKDETVSFIVFDELLLDVLSRYNIKYVLATNWRPDFYKALEEHPGFERVGPIFRGRAGDTVRIYRVREVASWSNREPIFTEPFRTRLLQLRKNRPEYFAEMVKAFASFSHLDESHFEDNFLNVSLPDDEAIPLPSPKACGYIPGVTSDHVDHVIYSFKGSPGGKVVQYEVYDVDFDIEVEVVLNGKHIGFAPVTRNNEWSGICTLELPENLINHSSDNQLAFNNTSNPPQTYIWGVRNVSIEQ